VRTNWVREKLKAGEPTIGCFTGLQSPNVAELLAHAGYDFLVIETEHNALDSAEIEHMLMAVSGSEAIPIVRVASAAPVYIQRALDLGAMGVVVPLVRTAAEAEAIVRATRLPPAGTRSWGPLRASRYTFDNRDYMDRANDNILVALILETREAVDNMEAIAATPGVDALFLGPADLSLAYGLDFLTGPHRPVEAAIEKMLRVCRAAGIACGLGDTSPEALLRWRERGCTFLVYGPDYMLLANTVREGLTRFRAGLAGRSGEGSP
jgi:2-keto-3-deoxy-L-rhamnonate aldolase RhmA